MALRSRFTGDFEQATLTETGADTNVFEGTFRLAVGGAAPNNFRLETGNSGPPEFRGDVVTAEYALYEAQAVTVGSSLAFLDAFGRETETYVPGETVRVRVVDATRNIPVQRDSV